MVLPPTFLNYDAMVKHHFLLRNEQFLQYRLIFDRRSAVYVTLPTPFLFDYQAKGRYVVTREEAAEHEGRAEVARQHAAVQEAFVAASQYDPSYNYGYQPGYPWHQTNLGQKPKLGGVRISHRLYIHVHTLFQSSVLILFHCIIHASLIFFFQFSSCVFDKP